MLLAALLALSSVEGLLLQDAQTLAWKLEKGTKFEATWTSDTSLKVEVKGRAPSDITATLRLVAAVEVLDVGAEGDARLELRPRVVEMKGSSQGKPFDILLEGEKIVRPEGFPPARAKAVMAPMIVKGSRNGRFEPQGEHPLKETFGGRGTLFGPELPEQPVKPGDTWKGGLQTGKGAAKGKSEYFVTYTLAGVEDGKSRVKGDEEQAVQEAPFPMKARFKSDGLFDPAAGRWVRFSLSTLAVGSDVDAGSAMEASSTFRFEAK
jgi:hypothetical protein